MKKIIISLVFIAFLITGIAQNDDSYTRSINDWHKARIAELKTPSSWLNLEGLFWLHKGANTIGKSKGNDCRYDNIQFPDQLGKFMYAGDSVMWVNDPKYSIRINGNVINGTKPVKVFSKKEENIIMSWSHFSWAVIKREDKMGIRFRNLEAKTLKEFKTINRFPVDSMWRIKATVLAPVKSLLMITNVLGQTTALKSAGKLLFSYEDKEYRLDVIDEGGPSLFIVFADQTAGESTYAAGRFIDIPKPDASGNTVIDFNKAYNPPCVFTPFATCPLPPAQNRLKLSITAGEKNYGHH